MNHEVTTPQPRLTRRQCLFGGAAVALAVGTRTLAVPETFAMDEHGSGEDTTMDMSMAAVAPEHAGLRVEWISEPAVAQPGEPVTLRYRVVDLATGQSLTDLPIVHEQPMHLIAISHDLAEFQHIHPELAADDTFQVETTFPTAGTYLLFNEFTWGEQTVLDRRELVAGQPSTPLADLAPDLTPKTVNGLTVALSTPDAVTAGQTAPLTFTVTRDGQPVTDLAPYLGAAAHVAILSQDGGTFAHTHGVPVADGHEIGGGHEGDDDHGVPTTFGPDVMAEHAFAGAGRHKVWVQFSHGGDVVTAAFVVDVEA